MKKVTSRNTKDEILTAYNKAISEIKNTKVTSAKLDADHEANLRVYQDAKAVNPQELTEQISTLRSTVNNDLQNLENAIVEKKKILDGLREAIGTMDVSLNGRYAIIAEAESLDALVQAQAQMKADFEAEKTEMEKVWKQEESDRARNWSKEDKARAEHFQDMKNNLSTQHAREIEAFEYNMNKRKERAEAELSDAWDDYNKHEAELLALREMKEAQPDLITQKVSVALAIAEKKHLKEFDHLSERFDVEIAAAEKISETKLEALISANRHLSNENVALQVLASTAAKRVEAIATDAVRYSRPVPVYPNGKEAVHEKN